MAIVHQLHYDGWWEDYEETVSGVGYNITFSLD